MALFKFLISVMMLFEFFACFQNGLSEAISRAHILCVLPTLHENISGISTNRSHNIWYLILSFLEIWKSKCAPIYSHGIVSLIQCHNIHHDSNIPSLINLHSLIHQDCNSLHLLSLSIRNILSNIYLYSLIHCKILCHYCRYLNGWILSCAVERECVSGLPWLEELLFLS